MVSAAARRIERLAQIEPAERRAVVLAFTCYFLLFASYYVLRPVRDTVATVFGVEQLPEFFTATLVGSVIASWLYALVARRVRLRALLPGMFWFWLVNIVLFSVLFRLAARSVWVGGSYYVWFSVMNLFMVSVFWSLMADLFTPAQATRLFGLIAAGGSTGAIAGPIVTRIFVAPLGLAGLLVLAAVAFVAVIALVHLLMREKERLRASGARVQRTTLEHGLAGHPLEGFRELLASGYSARQAGFMFLMTWVNTVAYFFQTELVARALPGITGRAVAIADIALVVNVASALILLFGLGHIMRRFGVTTGLVLNPLIMIGAFIAIALSPTLFMIQALQVVRSVSQYAIARPSREICFTVVDQAGRYRTKNVIDTVIYRLGDASSAWVQDGLRAAGLRIAGCAAVGIGVCVLWGAVALGLGRRYEQLRKQRETI